MATVTILGAGAWGTALAVTLARNGHAVTLAVRRETQLAALRNERANQVYLPGVQFPPDLRVLGLTAESLLDAEAVVMAIPSGFARGTLAPLAGAIPVAATAPALIVVGSLMMTTVADIKWTDPEIALPAFLTMMAIPMTFSIANGLAFGFCSWTALKILRGRFREVNWMVYALTALFVVRFWYMRAG